jgi:shikimate dehydrogenase
VRDITGQSGFQSPAKRFCCLAPEVRARRDLPLLASSRPACLLPIVAQRQRHWLDLAASFCGSVTVDGGKFRKNCRQKLRFGDQRNSASLSGETIALPAGVFAPG